MEEHTIPNRLPMPQYFVSETEIKRRLHLDNSYGWLAAFKSVTSPTNERSLISAALPLTAIANSLVVVNSNVEPERLSCLVANMNSFVLDYCARQKIGGVNLNFFLVNQLPVLSPKTFSEGAPWYSQETTSSWVALRALELTYTSLDLEKFGAHCDYYGPPFKWNEERRFLLRCELDVAFFHLYGIERNDVDYIMETFPIVKRHDERDHGEYRTKRVILEIYDEMAQAIETGNPYQTRLDPPPADPRVAHPQRTSV